MSGAVLSASGLRVRYGAVDVLKDVALEVREKEVVALIGANGAGKTTTLMALSGVVPAAAGGIRFLGEQIERLPAERRAALGLVQVPEGRRVFPRMSVTENLQLGACCRNDRPQAAADLERVFSLFPVLKQRRRQLAGTLSGGEQQMLALARGLMARPKLLLLDEPSLGLAPKLVAQVFDVIRRIHSQGVTILLVEQNAYQALRVADRAYVLETGRVVLEGPAERLRENPAVRDAYLGG